MEEASGSDLKFFINYLKQKRGMQGIKQMLKELNSNGVVISNLDDIGTLSSYPEDVYAKVIIAVAKALGGDFNERMNQLGYALGDRANLLKLITKLSTPRQVIKTIEDNILFSIPYLKSSSSDISKHVVLLRVTPRKNGEPFLSMAEGYIKAIIDLSNKNINIEEKKKDGDSLVFKLKLGEMAQGV
ncbi:MAG: hypothetical protein RXN92_00205 [Thermoplasmatales archaeon]|jgi:hypothetical protein